MCAGIGKQLCEAWRAPQTNTDAHQENTDRKTSKAPRLGTSFYFMLRHSVPTMLAREAVNSPLRVSSLLLLAVEERE